MQHNFVEEYFFVKFCVEKCLSEIPKAHWWLRHIQSHAKEKVKSHWYGFEAGIYTEQ